MPELSRFYGIIIRTYFDDDAPPHFHAAYGREEAVVGIELWPCWTDISLRAPQGLERSHHWGESSDALKGPQPIDGQGMAIG